MAAEDFEKENFKGGTSNLNTSLGCATFFNEYVGKVTKLLKDSNSKKSAPFVNISNSDNNNISNLNKQKEAVKDDLNKLKYI